MDAVPEIVRMVDVITPQTWDYFIVAVFVLAGSG